MDEAALRRILQEALDPVRDDLTKEIASVRDDLTKEIASVRSEVASVREEVATVRGDLRDTEERLTQGARLQFRQMRELYQGLTERMDGLEKELGNQFAQTRGAIDALHATVQSQDFRADQLARRVTALELRNPTE